MAYSGSCRWVHKGIGVIELLDVVLTTIWVLPRHQQGVARTRSQSPGLGNTKDILRLAAIERDNPVHAPAPQEGICNTTQVVQIGLALSKGQPIRSAPNESMFDMEAGQANIPFNSKARNVWSTKITTNTSATQQVICISQVFAQV